MKVYILLIFALLFWYFTVPEFYCDFAQQKFSLLLCFIWFPCLYDHLHRRHICLELQSEFMEFFVKIVFEAYWCNSKSLFSCRMSLKIMSIRQSIPVEKNSLTNVSCQWKGKSSDRQRQMHCSFFQNWLHIFMVLFFCLDFCKIKIPLVKSLLWRCDFIHVCLYMCSLYFCCAVLYGLEQVAVVTVLLQLF